MAFDMDRVMVARLVNRAVNKARKASFEVWQPGKKLKILMIGYNGARNTGSDVRVTGMVNQFYHILGKENVEIGVLTLDARLTEVYFKPPTRQIEFSSIYFTPLLKACNQYHMGVLSEGSTFKSKWANSLTLFFVEGAGIMKQQNKPCITYGSGAGEMDDYLREMVAKYCDRTYFISREQPTLDLLAKIGIKGELGTDTAWIFPPGEKEWAEKELKEKAGWDGKRPVLGVAVINPFWWPVKPSLTKWLSGYGRRHPVEHYQKWYFFASSKERWQNFERYLSGIARAVDEFASQHDNQVIIFGMEALDWDAINRLQKMLKAPAAIFSSKFYDGYQMVALLRALSLLVTSRYHARVCSMPGGVPAVAVSMDERLYNIYQEAGQLEDYYFTVDEPQLYEKLTAAMEKAWENRESLREKNFQMMPGYLKKMALMGKTFRNFVKSNFPEFPLPPEPADWQGYLPPLYPELAQIVKSREG